MFDRDLYINRKRNFNFRLYGYQTGEHMWARHTDVWSDVERRLPDREVKED